MIFDAKWVFSHKIRHPRIAAAAAADNDLDLTPSSSTRDAQMALGLFEQSLSTTGQSSNFLLRTSTDM